MIAHDLQKRLVLVYFCLKAADIAGFNDSFSFLFSHSLESSTVMVGYRGCRCLYRRRGRICVSPYIGRQYDDLQQDKAKDYKFRQFFNHMLIMTERGKTRLKNRYNFIFLWGYVVCKAFTSAKS